MKFPRFWWEHFSCIAFCFRMVAQQTPSEEIFQLCCEPQRVTWCRFIEVTVRSHIFTCLSQVGCFHTMFPLMIEAGTSPNHKTSCLTRPCLPLWSQSSSYKADLTKLQWEIWNSSPRYITDKGNIQGRISDKTVQFCLVFGCRFQ